MIHISKCYCVLFLDLEIKSFLKLSIKFDLVIVGSGPAGISLALELDNEKISILIIVAGNNNFNEHSFDVCSRTY